MILLNPSLLLHDLKLVPDFVLGKALRRRLFFDTPLIPLIHGTVKGFIFKSRATNQAMMMIMHGSNILINEGVMSIVMMMSVSAQLTSASLSNGAVPLSQHHYFVVFFAHQWGWRGHAYIHQRLLKSNARALQGGKVTASNRIQTVELCVIVCSVLVEITETVLVVVTVVVFRC